MYVCKEPDQDKRFLNSPDTTVFCRGLQIKGMCVTNDFAKGLVCDELVDESAREFRPNESELEFQLSSTLILVWPGLNSRQELPRLHVPLLCRARGFVGLPRVPCFNFPLFTDE